MSSVELCQIKQWRCQICRDTDSIANTNKYSNRVLHIVTEKNLSCTTKWLVSPDLVLATIQIHMAPHLSIFCKIVRLRKISGKNTIMWSEHSEGTTARLKIYISPEFEMTELKIYSNCNKLKCKTEHRSLANASNL